MAWQRRQVSAPGRAVGGRWAWIRASAALAALAALLLRLGWRQPVLPDAWLSAAEWAALIGFAVTIVIGGRRGAGSVPGAVRRAPVRAGLVALAFVTAWWPLMVSLCVAALVAVEALDLFMRVVARARSNATIFAGAFAVLIAGGTLALSLPVATPEERPISLVDAAFTSTSAVCVTGLVVRDTATEFSRAGQWIILVLMQLGGLGIVIFGALIALAIGSSMGIRLSRTLSDAAAHGHAGPTSVRALVLFIVTVTLAFEAVGAAALYLGWPGAWPGPGPDLADPLDRAFHAGFFAVSAFCNAGFATAGTSLEGLRFHWTSHVVVAGLIVLGGLGFPVLDNLRAMAWARIRRVRMERGALVRLTLHTRLVLITSLALYAAGALAIALGRLAQGGEGVGAALLDGHFMSITARTAGFDTVAPGSMGPLSRLTLITLMFIGGSPGSTAGGVKTVAVAVIVLTIWSTIRGRATTTAFGREIAEALVRRAATLITLGAATIALLTLALALTDGRGRLLGDLLFEVVSASSTVGLTTGMTPELSPAGRVVLIVAMFLGRVGPLVVLGALATVGTRHRPTITYPSEHVVMG
ncbi:MAG: potassium transporter KtrB [Planctomycetota bacterium]|nr:MAG: potassium transporter KtrB [Planctomycetota bacterium]